MKSNRSCNKGTSWRDSDDLERARFTGLPDSTARKVLFDGWDSWTVYAWAEAKKFIVQMIKEINAQVIGDPSMTRNIGGQAIQAKEVIVTFVIVARDLKLPFGDEEDDYETLAEPTIVEVTPSVRRNKRKETTKAQDSVVQPDLPEEPAVAPIATLETNEELQEAFDTVEEENKVSEGDKEKTKEGEEDVRFLAERIPVVVGISCSKIDSATSSTCDTRKCTSQIPAEVIAKSIELAKKQKEAQRTEPTSSKLAPFDDVEAKHSVAVAQPEVEEDKTAETLAVVTCPLKPPIVAISIIMSQFSFILALHGVD
ncbi:hypothetical protein L3X38_003506 [Prunus dulcis]|uniref:Uncharacterized protein n=1 Tax=Prunus dulcis TaxID=3755 RepID=A0AAD5F291_PRUDU|nr:hypothetical protein L3X38_003506 [Prunus dulcis]